MTDTPPIVTMSDDGTTFLDGAFVGEIDERWEPLRIWLTPPARTARELRVLATFLEQLEGANLLSGVGRE